MNLFRLKRSGGGVVNLAERWLGSKRTLPTYYDLVYWWAARTGLSSFNYGYAPATEAILCNPAYPQPYQIEMYRQAAEAVGAEDLRGRTFLEVSAGLGGGLNYLMRQYRIGTGVALDLAMPALRAAR